MGFCLQQVDQTRQKKDKKKMIYIVIIVFALSKPSVEHI